MPIRWFSKGSGTAFAGARWMSSCQLEAGHRRPRHLRVGAAAGACDAGVGAGQARLGASTRRTLCTATGSGGGSTGGGGPKVTTGGPGGSDGGGDGLWGAYLRALDSNPVRA